MSFCSWRFFAVCKARVVLAVVLVCLAVFIIFSVRSCSAERDAPSSEQTEETPAADAQEPDEPEKTEQTQADEEESGPLMTLTDDELAYYLDQVEWDDNFQAYIDADTEQHDDPYFYQKLYLELNPDITIPGFGNPYGEGAAFVDVEAIQMYDAQVLRYVHLAKESAELDAAAQRRAEHALAGQTIWLYTNGHGVVI